MTTGLLATPLRRERDLFAFLQRELAPSTDRWHNTLRTTLACAFCIALVMILQIPQGEFLMITLFLVSKNDAWSSVNRAVLRVIGTFAGGGLAILSIIAFADKPGALLAVQAVVLGASLFFNRTTTAPYAFMMVGVTYLMVAPDFVADAAFDVEKGLWRTLLTTIGALVGTAVQVLLWRDHPEALLLDDLCRRLEKVEGFIARRGGAVAHLADPVEASGMAAQLDLLKEAEAMSNFLRQRHTEQIKLICEVQRLTSAAVRLDRSGIDLAAIPAWMAARLDAVRLQCAHLRQSVASRHAPAPWRPRPTGERPSGRAEVEVFAAIEEMESALIGLPRSLAFLDTPPESGSVHADVLPREPVAVESLLTPACTLANTEVLQHAIKGALAATLCGIVYTALHAPQLSTSVITCLVVAQSTVGAGRHKSLLRIAGTVAGGVLALIAILVLIPNMVSLASFLVVITPLFGLASWVVSGSSRSSYIGIQMAITLSLVLINGLHPSIDLSVASDRFLGVAMGTLIFGAVDLLVWPVFARTAIRRKLAQAVSLMADVHRAATGDDEIERHRCTILTYRTFSEALALQDGLELEPETHEEDARERQASLRLTGSLQEVFLPLLGALRHQPALRQARLEPSLAAGMHQLDTDICAVLEAVSTAIESGAPVGRSLELSAAPLDAVSRVSRDSPEVLEAVVVYRELLAAIAKLRVDLPAA